MEELSGRLREICERFGVVSLYVFGSRAKEIAARVAGTGHGASAAPASDVDIAVQPARGALESPRERVALVYELEELFGAPRVDLVILTEASAFVAVDAVRGELLYCDNLDCQAREELYYFRRAADLAPLQRARLEGILSGEIQR
jgi:predicted nucleotidyltransferase